MFLREHVVNFDLRIELAKFGTLATDKRNEVCSMLQIMYKAEVKAFILAKPKAKTQNCTHVKCIKYELQRAIFRQLLYTSCVLFCNLFGALVLLFLPIKK